MALTERYVRADAAGGGDGTTDTNSGANGAYTWAEMLSDIATNGGSGGRAGYRYNIKAGVGTYSRTTTADSIATTTAGTSTSPIILRGFSSSITDGYQGRTAGGGLVTTNMPSITYTTGSLAINGQWIILEALNFSAATNGTSVAITQNCVAKSCKTVNSSTNASAIALSASTNSVVFDCDIELSGASGGSFALTLSTTTGRAIGNRVKGGPAGCIRAAGASALVALNTLYAGAGALITVNNTIGTPAILFNTIVGGSSDGVDIITGATALQCIIGNIITDNGGYAVDLNSAAVAAFAAYNRTRDNTSGAYNLGTDWLTATKYGDVTTDTGGPSTDYVDSGSNDYRLIAASPATSAAQPASASIGALQRDQAAASGGASSFAFVG